MPCAAEHGRTGRGRAAPEGTLRELPERLKAPRWRSGATS